MTPAERSKLLDALLEGDIGEADLLRIEAELSVDPDVRQEYYRRIQLDLLLEREALEDRPVAVQTRPLRSWWSGRSGLLVGVLIGAAASLLLAVAFYPNSDVDADAQTRLAAGSPTELSATGFAILSGQANAIWTSESLADGCVMPTGPLHLASGQIHLELFSGVQMVIEGESVFSIDSPMQVTMSSGRARAHVPEPAQGFRIKTNSGDVVDLGTEFTVDVDNQGTDVQVVDGEVELRPLSDEVRRIQSGNTLRLADDGTIADSSADPLELIGPSEFQDLLAKQQNQQFLRWQQSAQTERHNPRLLASYQFAADQQEIRGLDNLATGSAEAASDGAIVAAKQSVDRWGRSAGALDFSRVGSRVRVTVPGEHRGLTLLCWVKINSLDRWYNSLFLTDGHEDREPHWQIMDDGRIFFSVKIPADAQGGGKVRQHEYYSPKIWDASLSGQWIMLGVTYDVEGGRVTHYLNGRPLSSEVIPAPALVESIRIGAASICNWNQPMYRTDPKFVLRNLNGSMDEFAIYSGALSSDEIRQLYRLGNPHEL